MARKHVRTQNTGLIGWGLLRQLSEAMAHRRERTSSTVLGLMKQHLADGTPLADELALHRTLWSARGVEERIARRVVHSVLGAAAGLDLADLSRRRDALLSEAREAGVDPLQGCESWTNYRQIAAEWVLIRSAQEDRIDEAVDDARLEEEMVRFLSTAPETTALRPDRDRNGLALQLAVEGFNKKYAGTLSKRQAELIDAMIVAESGGDRTRLDRVGAAVAEEVLSELRSFKTDDEQLSQRIGMVVEHVSTTDRVGERWVTDLLEAQAIVEEIHR